MFKLMIPCSYVLILSVAALAQPTTFKSETQVSVSEQSKFTASAGWSFDSATKKLVSPEGDLSAYLLEKQFSRDFESQSLEAWKSIDPKFAFRVLDKTTPPAKDGWDEIHQIIYDVPAKENRVVMTAAHVFNEKVYLLLIDSSNAGLAKRASQLQIVGDTWTPSNLKKEDLSQNKIKNFSMHESQEMDLFIQHAMKSFKIPGVSVGILQNGKLVYRKGFGFKKLGSKEKVTPETLFMIGSTTKPLTTLMLSKLIEQGKLSWDTPIHNVLPQFNLANQEVTGKFLVKHAACACTGMPRRDLDFVFGSKNHSVEDSLKQLSGMEPTTGFGETFQYSNHLVMTGGLVGGNVYAKTGDLFSKYESAMNELVFAPLKMTASRVKPLPSDAKLLAAPHARDMNGEMVPFPQEIDDMVYAVAPAGSVWSNVDDLAKYLAMELNLGKSPSGEQLYAREQIETRRKAGVRVDDTTSYGLGLFLENNKGIRIIGHGGNTMGFTHDLFFLPDHGVGMIIQANAGSVNGLRNSLKQKLLELLLDAKPKSEETLNFAKNIYSQMSENALKRTSLKTPDTKWIRDYVGKYQNKDLGEATIAKTAKGYEFQTVRWKSRIGSAKDSNGEHSISLTSAPWSGGSTLRVEKKPKRTLILDDEQVQYEFTPIKDSDKNATKNASRDVMNGVIIN